MKIFRKKTRLSTIKPPSRNSCRSWSSPFVQAIFPTIDRGLIVNRLAGIIGLDARQINEDLNKRLDRFHQARSRYAKPDPQMQKPLDTDFGSGFFAVAQRELLEVLLNEPKLFEIVKQKITPNIFDVPILSQIAGIYYLKF